MKKASGVGARPGQFEALPGPIDLPVMAGGFSLPIQPSVTMCAPGSTMQPIKALQGVARPVRNVLEANPTGVSILRQFDCADDEDLAHRASPALGPVDGIVFRAEGHLGLVDFDEVLKEAPIRVDHRAPEFVQKKPRGLVTAKTELRLELQRQDAV